KWLSLSKTNESVWNDVWIAGKWLLDKMADKNVSASAPTRSDDQILPFAAWVLLERATMS
ncbi:hypothetical protein Tco_0020700, partial [Tanacetum coccineum]